MRHRSVSGSFGAGWLSAAGCAGAVIDSSMAAMFSSSSMICTCGSRRLLCANCRPSAAAAACTRGGGCLLAFRGCGWCCHRSISRLAPLLRAVGLGRRGAWAVGAGRWLTGSGRDRVAARRYDLHGDAVQAIAYAETERCCQCMPRNGYSSFSATIVRPRGRPVSDGSTRWIKGFGASMQTEQVAARRPVPLHDPGAAAVAPMTRPGTLGSIDTRSVLLPGAM